MAAGALLNFSDSTVVLIISIPFVLIYNSLTFLILGQNTPSNRPRVSRNLPSLLTRLIQEKVKNIMILFTYDFKKSLIFLIRRVVKVEVKKNKRIII